MTLISDARTATEASLLDTCVITAPSTAAPTLDAAGRMNVDADAVVWSGPCSIGTTAVALVRTGPTEGTAYTHVVRIPMSATTVALGQVVTVSAVRDGGNPNLLGLAMVIAELPEKSTMVLRRLHCARMVTTGVTP